MENLRYFCTVVQTGNLAEAADRLGRTQSALSTSLKNIESHLGVKLFDGERKNRLSLAGEQIYELAKHQIQEFDLTIQQMETQVKATKGLVRIASVPSVAAIVFPTLLNNLHKQYPGVKVELRDTDTQQVLNALVNAKADIGITSGFHPVNGFAATRLFNDSFGLVCKANHALITQKKSPSIQEVVTTDFVRNSLCDLIKTPSFVAALNHVDVTVHNNQSLINIIRTGRWVSVLPKAVSDYLPNDVAFRALSNLPDKREVWLYYKEQSRYQELIDACCELIDAVKRDDGIDWLKNDT